MRQSIEVDAGRQRSRPVWQFLLVIAIALPCAPGSSAAQVDEVVAGASGNAVLRGPWVTAPWRKPLPRLAVFTLGSFTYEKFVDHSGWSWSDFNQRLASYLVTEAMLGGMTWLRTRLARRDAPRAGVPGGGPGQGRLSEPGPAGGAAARRQFPLALRADAQKVVVTPFIPTPFGRGETQFVRRSPS